MWMESGVEMGRKFDMCTHNLKILGMSFRLGFGRPGRGSCECCCWTVSAGSGDLTACRAPSPLSLLFAAFFWCAGCSTRGVPTAITLGSRGLVRRFLEEYGKDDLLALGVCINGARGLGRHSEGHEEANLRGDDLTPARFERSDDKS